MKTGNNQSEHGVSDKGTSETGRGIVKEPMHNLDKVHRPRNLTQVETGKHKRDFRP